VGVCVCVRTPYVLCESCPLVPQPTTRPHLHNTPNHTRDSRVSPSLSINLSLALTRARALSHSCTTLWTNNSLQRARAISLSLSSTHLSLAYTHTHLHDTLNQTISSKHDISVSPVSTRDDTVSREMPTPCDISTLCSSEHLRTTLFEFPAASA
jgi:hypothetical protein